MAAPGSHTRKERMTRNDDVQIYSLPNGITLIAEAVPHVRSVAATILVPAGGKDDPPDRRGLASAVCEMMSRGCGDRDSRQFVLELDNLGVERNESVSPMYTAFGFSTLADKLGPTMEIYGDYLRRPRLPEEHLGPIRRLLLQELQSIEDDPTQKVFNELRRLQYPSPWGESPQGTAEGVAAIELDEMRRFHQQHMHAGEVIIGVAGSFDFASVRDSVQRHFGDWESTERESVVEAVPAVRSMHLPYDSSQTHIGISFPSVPYRHGDYFQAFGAVCVLSGGMSARLFTEVRERRGLCYTVFASQHSLQHLGSVLCYAGTSAERAQETLDVTVSELLRLADGVTEEELARVKARIKSSLIMQQEMSAARSSAVARDWFHLGRVRSVGELEQIVDALTPETINTYLEANPPSELRVVTMGPEPLTMPSSIE